MKKQTKAEQYVDTGKTLYDQGKFEEACAEYEKATQIQPRYALAYYQWGKALDSLERYDEAIEKYRKATEIDPVYADAFCNWGLALYSLERYDEAIEKYRKATEIDPVYADAFCNWGLALYSLKRCDEAIEKYRKTTEIKPDHADAFYNWGLALDCLKCYSEAIEKYTKATENNPTDPYPHHNIADLLFRSGMYKEGRRAWEKTIGVYRQAQEKKTESSSTAAFYQYYGDVLFSVFGQLDEAERIYKKGLSIDPSHTGVLGSLCGLYLERAGENPEQRSAYYMKALESQQKAVALLTKQPEKRTDQNTLLLLGKLFLTMESYENAKEYLLQALQKEKESAELYTNLGVLYSRIEDFNEALRYFKAALERDPDDLNVCGNLAEVYLKLNLKDKAEVEYKRILRRAQDNIESYIGLGEVYLAMGGDDEDMYDKAIGCFNKALEIADSERRSKNLRRKERAAVLYSRAYARVTFYEKAPIAVKDEKELREAMKDFAECYRLDPDNHKSERASEKLAKRLDRVSPRWFADKVAPWVVAGLSFVSFVFTQIRFFSVHATPQKPIQDVGSYALLTFGSLIFVVAGLYLPQILKLKVAGIELEKKPVEQITTSVSLGITR